MTDINDIDDRFRTSATLTSCNKLPDVVTSGQLADFLQVPLSTVNHWRRAKEGPPWIKIGRHVRYRRGDIESWLHRIDQS